MVSYEQEIRKGAMRRVISGASFETALRTSWADPVLKERFFTTPLAMNIGVEMRAELRVKRPLEGAELTHRSKKAKAEPPKKSVGKGMGKGPRETSAKDRGIAAKTPEGDPVCFAFNSEGCRRKNCRYKHACGRCFGKHPLSECSRQAGAVGDGAFQ